MGTPRRYTATVILTTTRELNPQERDDLTVSIEDALNDMSYLIEDVEVYGSDLED